MDNITSVIKYAMSMEKKAQEFYGSFSKSVHNESIKELFKRLASIEGEHYKLLSDKLSDFEKDNDTSVLTLPAHENFEKALNEVQIVDFDKESADLPILRMAYLMEEDFARYYRKSADMIEDANVKAFLLELSMWEEDHGKLFYNEYERVMKENWFSQSFYPF